MKWRSLTNAQKPWVRKTNQSQSCMLREISQQDAHVWCVLWELCGPACMLGGLFIMRICPDHHWTRQPWLAGTLVRGRAEQQEIFCTQNTPIHSHCKNFYLSPKPFLTTTLNPNTLLEDLCSLQSWLGVSDSTHTHEWELACGTSSVS